MMGQTMMGFLERVLIMSPFSLLPVPPFRSDSRQRALYPLFILSKRNKDDLVSLRQDDFELSLVASSTLYSLERTTRSTRIAAWGVVGID